MEQGKQLSSRARSLQIYVYNQEVIINRFDRTKSIWTRGSWAWCVALCAPSSYAFAFPSAGHENTCRFLRACFGQSRKQTKSSNYLTWNLHVLAPQPCTSTSADRSIQAKAHGTENWISRRWREREWPRITNKRPGRILLWNPISPSSIHVMAH